MDFSESYRFSGPQPAYSPDGRFVANCVEYRLVIREVETLQVVQLYSCIDKIQQLEWCPNSRYVLCALWQRATVQVWSVSDPDWTCKISEGDAGVAHARWSPDGLHVLVVADFQIRVTVWSLVHRTAIYVKGPKWPQAGLAFSPDGALMALAERHDCKDYVSLFRCHDWQPAAHFQVATADLADLAFSPDGACLAVWDSPLTYRLLVFSAQGEPLAEYSAYSDALGIKSVAWSPSGQVLALGSFDQEARLLNHVDWQPLAALGHMPSITGPAGVVVYREVEDHSTDSAGSRSRYVVCELPARVQSQKVPVDKPNPRVGVGHMAFSTDCQYVTTRNDNMPNALWVWDVARMELASVLLQVGAVRDVQWDPHHPRCVVATGSSRIYIWSPDGASCVHIPLQSFQAHSVSWNTDGAALILADKDAFCCAYLGSSIS
ncbi:hypothetical protein WJX72_005821 [[Myrmecia] bisecta]|uniref:WD repeat-containing protein WRAP73 n=1 Tax=[Myrmecia] bisecta TaxID=41462 RepID=A0AAW1Q3F8_9CHLO